MADAEVAAERLPGIGWRYTVPAQQGRQLVIVVEDQGPRHLVLVDPRLDSPITTVRLTDTEAAVVAALLSGARFSFRPPARLDDDTRDPDEVVVETVHVGSGSPVVGTPQEVAIPRMVPHATLLGVIDDRTPELVETDVNRSIRAGDKLVVAARRSQLEALRAAI